MYRPSRKSDQTLPVLAVPLCFAKPHLDGLEVVLDRQAQLRTLFLVHLTEQHTKQLSFIVATHDCGN